MKKRVDLIADLGEGYGYYTVGDDGAMLELVSSVNIACGFHAGDPQIMYATVERCKALGVGIGAHPGFPDLVGFGRRDMDLSTNEIETDVIYQVGALMGFTRALGVPLQHVSPHGRLGNRVVVDEAYAEAVVRAVERVDDSLIIVSQPGALIDRARSRGLRSACIALADRAYEDDGTLVSRKKPGAVLHDEEEIVGRVLRMVLEGRVTSISGNDVSIECDSVLLHGDTPGASSFASRVREELVSAGVEIAALEAVISS